MSIFDRLDEKMNSLIRRMNGKTIIIWGYGDSGRCLESYLNRRGVSVDYVLDNYLNFPGKFNVYTTRILSEFDSRNCHILVAFPANKDAEIILTEYGYDCESSTNICEYLFGEDRRKFSYYDTLEALYGVDITSFKQNGFAEREDYSYGNDYSLVRLLDNFVFDSNDSIFDFGCGKGGPMILFADKGVKVGGCEYDKELYKIAVSNVDKCGLSDINIFNCDAVQLREELDVYNYFYMYNPFSGSLFRQVIDNIEASYDRVPRKITLIYSGVTHHKEVIRNGYFRLTKKIETDYWNKYSNVYMIG